MNEDLDFTIDLREYFRGGTKHAIIGGLIGLIAGFVYGTVAPKWYAAEVSVVPATASKSGIGLPGAAAALGVTDLPFDLGGGTDVDRISAIFHSRSVTDSVISKFNLIRQFRAKYVEDVREELWKHCSTKIDKKASVLILSCEDKVPETAQAMVAYFAETANQVARRVSTSSAGEERRFLETRVLDARSDLEKASSKLRDFQERNRVISLPEQAKAIVTAMATLRAELLDKQMQLAYLESFSSSDESTSGGLRRQIAILQSKLKSMEESRVQAPADAATKPQAAKHAPDRPGTGGLFPPAMSVPLLQFELEQLMRDQKIQEALFGLLTQRYELARVNEARDTSSFQVLDSPTVPTRKTRPRRLLFTAGGLAAGAFVGFLATIFVRRKQAPKDVRKGADAIV